jgi:hypothetical protein
MSATHAGWARIKEKPPLEAVFLWFLTGSRTVPVLGELHSMTAQQRRTRLGRGAMATTSGGGASRLSPDSPR